jgi:general secretion pathway protein I
MNYKNTGFTLLEVMVALFIIAVALGGAIKVMGNAANNSSRLVDKTFANWVALNQITELRLKGEWPKQGETSGDQEMADRVWTWKQKTIKTEDDNIKRIELSVWGESDNSEEPYVTVVGFLAKP